MVVNQGGSANVAGRTGVVVWNSGSLLARVLNLLEPTVFRGKTVLELGCGTGLNSIVASKLGASTVYATDGNGLILELAQENVKLNHANVKIKELSWGWMDAMEFDEQIDIVLGSDLTYNSNGWNALAQTMDTILSPNGFILYLTCGHSGFTVDGEINGFRTVLSSTTSLKSLSTTQITQRLWNSLTPKEQQIIGNKDGIQLLLLTRKTNIQSANLLSFVS